MLQLPSTSKHAGPVASCPFLGARRLRALCFHSPLAQLGPEWCRGKGLQILLAHSVLRAAPGKWENPRINARKMTICTPPGQKSDFGSPTPGARREARWSCLLSIPYVCLLLHEHLITRGQCIHLCVGSSHKIWMWPVGHEGGWLAQLGVNSGYLSSSPA